MITKQLHFLLPALVLHVAFPFDTYSQIQQEYETHLKSINAAGFQITMGETSDSVNGARAFVDYTASYLVEKPADKYFISNRSLLEPLSVAGCDILNFKIADTLKSGKRVEINLALGTFVAEGHTLRKSVDSTMIYKIDNQVPYGAAYQLPEHEITNLSITVGGKSLLIPKEAYSNFYRLNMCHLNNFFRGIEAYESMNGQYIYLYLFGGTVGDVWFAKLVFDHEKYITRIVSDYYVLELHDSFREEFIGF